MVTVSDRSHLRAMALEIRAVLATNPAEPRVSTGPLDADVLERVANFFTNDRLMEMSSPDGE